MADLRERLQASVADRFVIEREIGRGGMATVFLAQDRKHRRAVAIKVLNPDLAELIGSDRFLREIELAARLTHPHILPLYDSGEVTGEGHSPSLLYYVMPFVEGESLRDRLEREKQLPLDEAVQLAREVADALSYAHSHDVVHRDIKPENIMLVAKHAVVVDFGVARAISAAAGDRLTGTGMAIGTASYMSPEQAVGSGELDGRSDIYSLGCVLYEMLAGEPPFQGPNPQAILARRFTDPIPSLRTVRDGIPEPLEQSIYRAMARVPADRFTTAAQFIVALAAPGREPRLREKPAMAGRWLAVAGVAVIALLAAGWVLLRTRSPSIPVSATRIAVLPFSIQGGSGLSYLAEGMVDLLSRDLDGAGDLHTVDPATIITLATRSDGSGLIDAERAQALARRVGAGLYVSGSVTAVGSQIRIQATLERVNGSPGDRTEASVQGDSGQLFGLVDQLSSLLLAKWGSEVTSRLAGTAATTTPSLPALKAYLEGERRLRTASLQPARIDSAIAEFRNAVAADSTFALAYYRMAVAAGWTNRHTVATEAAARALGLSDRLADRDRRLLKAYVAYRNGTANEAENLYRAVLRDYPDDLEAAFQLGDLLYNYNPLRGRPRAEAREAFDHVLAFDPGFL